MNNMMQGMAGLVLLLTLGVGSSQAQHTYTNNALRGCYGFLSNSVDVPQPTSTVGTICFDGTGRSFPTLASLTEPDGRRLPME
jgi:hypothetical protein